MLSHLVPDEGGFEGVFVGTRATHHQSDLSHARRSHLWKDRMKEKTAEMRILSRPLFTKTPWQQPGHEGWNIKTFKTHHLLVWRRFHEGSNSEKWADGTPHFYVQDKRKKTSVRNVLFRSCCWCLISYHVYVLSRITRMTVRLTHRLERLQNFFLVSVRWMKSERCSVCKVKLRKWKRQLFVSHVNGSRIVLFTGFVICGDACHLENTRELGIYHHGHWVVIRDISWIWLFW